MHAGNIMKYIFKNQSYKTVCFRIGNCEVLHLVSDVWEATPYVTMCFLAMNFCLRVLGTSLYSNRFQYFNLLSRVVLKGSGCVVRMFPVWMLY